MTQALLFKENIEAKSDKAENVTPLMAQYLRLKEQNRDYLLFFRLGDFYELFFDDAVQAASALDIALTKRGKHQGEDIPMCGVPWHQADIYLARLIRQGFKVALCEQVETELTGKNKIMDRKVVRIITPGTVTEENLLEATKHNYIAAIVEAQGVLALSWLDVSTGEFFSTSSSAAEMMNHLVRLEPREILISEKLLQQALAVELQQQWGKALNILPQSRFSAESAAQILHRTFNVATLDGFGDFNRAEITAAGALLDYVQLTQSGKLPTLAPICRYGESDFMGLDAATARNLELRRKLSGEYEGSLLSAIDRTLTSAGARLLEDYLLSPLRSVSAVNSRLDTVAYFAASNAREDLRDHLKGAPDLERALSRLTLGRGSPRDLASVREGLRAATSTAEKLQADTKKLPSLLLNIAQSLGHHDALIDQLQRALAPELPVFARDGNFIARGYDNPLDHLREMRDESRRLIANLQTEYVRQTGVSTLKIRHNNILGYYIEVPPKQAERLREPFIHRQSLSTSTRFTTVELGEMEQKLAKAADQALGLELKIFDDLVKDCLERAPAILQAARALAQLDVFLALAELAVTQNYTRPIVDESKNFSIKGGRHPVVEMALLRDAQQFIANDSDLGAKALWLITGPNMAGKSTYLRQNALIAILAQMGSFVPATSCHIGIIDKVFSRVGAADDLARGRSTFMVEMIETAAILNQATERSLVILDEIGRGTATFDGLSLAWATLEHLHDQNKCRGLFATHYHELTELSKSLDHLACYTMSVKEWEDQIIFLHEVRAGTADRSYGIHVAKLAGLPGQVIQRAGQILATLEASQHHDPAQLNSVLAELKAAPVVAIKPAKSKVENMLSEINPDDLSPKDALDILYKLKKAN